MIDIFDLMDKKFDLLNKTKNLSDYITKQKIFFLNSSFLSFFEIFSQIFHYWKYNDCYLSAKDLLQDLGIIKFIKPINSNEKIMVFVLSNDTNCCMFLQFLQNALNFTSTYFKDFGFEEKFKVIQGKILYIMGKMHYRFLRKNGYYTITDSSPIVRNVAEISDEETAFKLLSYNEVENANNIEHKRQILKYLANITEPITKDYDKKSGDKYELYNNLDFALNNLNIRHNNIKGKNENDFIKNVNECDLISYYDDTFNLIVSVLAMNNSEQSFNNIEKIRSTFKK